VIRVPVELGHDEGYNYIEDGRDAENSRDTRTRWRGSGAMFTISRAATTRMAQVARTYEDLKVQRVRRCSVWGTMAVRGRTSVLRCAAEEWRPTRCVHRQARMIIRQCSDMRLDQAFLNWKRSQLSNIDGDHLQRRE
jgi:hypothetical protein